MKWGQKEIIITGIAATLGALLMFAGDMLLYYTPNNIDITADSNETIASIMAHLSTARIMFGGALGPLAAFLYGFGFYPVKQAILPKYKKLSISVFLLLTLGIILGGAYHSQFPNIGFASQNGANKVLQLAQNYIAFMGVITMVLLLLGSGVLAVLIVLKKTHYPRWFAVLNPAVLFFASELFQFVPQPFFLILKGGWFSIIFVIFFTVSSILLSKKTAPTVKRAVISSFSS